MRTRRFVAPLAALAVVAAFGMWLHGAVPDVPTGTWLPGPALAQPRMGATSVTLSDGSVLVIGGRAADGPVRTVDVYGADGVLRTGRPLGIPRAGHAAAALPDGSVLVVGGTTTALAEDGSTREVPTGSAELYVGGAWMAVGSLSAARTGHTATALPDGRVLVAGGSGEAGAAIDSLEVYDPAQGTFSFLTVLPAGVTEHAAALAGETRVLIAGGRSGGAVLDSASLVDVDTASVVPVMLGGPRAAASATTLLDGRVFIAGGYALEQGADGSSSERDLATSEIVNTAVSPAAVSVGPSMAQARRVPKALLLPNNNTVLVTGGTNHDTVVTTAEQFLPWANAFRATNSPSTPRTGASLASLKSEGVALMAAGTAAQTELYGFATLKTDKDDYSPGTTVYVSGAGWQPGETVTLTLHEVGTGHSDLTWDTVADAMGRITSGDFAPDMRHVGVRFYLTARGVGSMAQVTFTDATNLKKVTVTNQQPSPVNRGNSAQFTVAVEFVGAGSCTVGLEASALPAGVTVVSFSPTTLTASSNTALISTLTLQTSGSTPGGDSSFTVTARGTGGSGNNCASAETQTATGTLTMSAVTATTTTVSSSLSPSTFGQAVNFTATVSPNSGSASPTGSVQFKVDGVNFGAPVALVASGTTATAASNSIASLTASGSPHTIGAEYLPAGSFSASTGSFNQVVNKATVTVTADNKTKTYDATAFTAFTSTFSGFVNGDTVDVVTGTVTYSGLATTAVNVGTYSITPVVSGLTAANYTFTPVEGTLTIDKRTASVTPAAASKIYGDPDPALTGTLAGFVATDGVTATYTRTPGETVAGGPYTISATLAPEGALENYEITYNTAAFTIKKRAASVTPNAVSKTYGDSDPALTGTLVGFMEADGVTATYARTPGETVAGGPYMISATLAPEGVLVNYEITYNTAEFAINRRTASVTPNAAGKTYGDPDPALTGTLAGFVATDGVTATYARTPGETVADGPYTISATLVPEGVLLNYDITYNTAEFTINTRAASVTANAASKIYGDSDPTLTGTLTGFMPADNVTATYSRTSGENVGTYTISAALSPASVLGNYAIAVNSAPFIINQRPLTVTANSYTITYGAPTPSFDVTYGTFVLGDTSETAISGTPVFTFTGVAPTSYPSSTTAPTEPGNYSIDVSGLSSVNYLLQFVPGSFKIQFGWSGFLQPINDTAHQIGTTLSKFKLGQTIPAKFVLLDAAGNVVQQTSSPTFTRSALLGACDPALVTDTAEIVAADTTPVYRWDGSQYHYNWSTKGLAAGKYRIFANLADGTQRFVEICLTK